MLKYKILFVIFLLTTEAKYLSEKPSFFQDCNSTDPDFFKCFGYNFDSVLKQWKDGIPGLKTVGSFDPFHVKHITLAHNSGRTIAINADFENVEVTGSNNLTIQETSLDTTQWIARFKILVPKLHFDADYKMNGRILTVPLEGHGKCFFEIDNMLFNLRIDSKLRTEDNFTFTDTEAVKVEIDSVEASRSYLHNLFDGEKELEKSTNAIFNDNWREFFVILKPVIEETMAAVLMDRFKKTYAYVPANYLINDIPKS